MPNGQIRGKATNSSEPGKIAVSLGADTEMVSRAAPK